MTSFQSWVLSAALVFALPGCLIVDDDIDDDPGTLTLAWSVDGAVEPADCAFYGIDRLELTVYDIFDDPLVTSYALCEEFELSIRLPEGYYSADATLIDSFDRSVTRTQVIDDIDIIEDEELYIPVDFPPRFFL
ncbi:MAG TPA: hypothetical protein VNN80_09465 [Polyangiaceae bacterium]|jgi:hypothetical protein|nr:hypothetical protein [Polyangiaceae bacterium]